jgi:hypothetical protein
VCSSNIYVKTEATPGTAGDGAVGEGALAIAGACEHRAGAGHVGAQRLARTWAKRMWPRGLRAWSGGLPSDEHESEVRVKVAAVGSEAGGTRVAGP